jgi:curved DNA-binding protein
VPDHYQTLGLSRTATAEEIKRAYRRLASQHHPDKGGDTQQFQAIQQAYDVLSDPEKKSQYDNPGQRININFGGANFDFDDIFGMFNQQARAARRNHFRMSLWVTLQDVFAGATKLVSVGTAVGSSTVEIEIPKGVQDGDNVQYPRIAPGEHDLVVQFRIKPDPVWQRNGLDLITEKKVDVWKLLLGADLQIIDPVGSELMTHIPARTQPGSLLRLKKRGMLSRTGQQGDILIRLNAVFPAHIDPEVMHAIEKHCK